LLKIGGNNGNYFIKKQFNKNKFPIKMEDDHYELLHALSKHPATGRYLPSVSRYTYEQSEDILRTIICNEDIVESEINAYLATNPERFSVFFFLKYTDLDGDLTKHLRGLYCAVIRENEYEVVSGNAKLDIPARGFKRFNITDELDIGLSFGKRTKLNNYDDVIRKLNIPLNLKELQNATWMIFFDPFTNYNIFMNRINCNKLIQNYSNHKATEQFNNILSMFSDKSEIHLLLVYLTYSLRVIGLKESMYLLKIVGSEIRYHAEKYINICDNYINIITEKLNE
jgi:hypothetical protein